MAAALALVFLIFVITVACMTRVAATYTRASLGHRQTAALFLAEAGIRKAGQRLLADRSYAGEKGTRLESGTFDVTVEPVAAGYAVVSTGRPDSAVRSKFHKTVRATIKLVGGRFRVTDWREQ